MEYKVIWVPLAVETYMEEIDFIFLKWNQNEVDDFNEDINDLNQDLNDLQPTLDSLVDDLNSALDELEQSLNS